MDADLDVIAGIRTLKDVYKFDAPCKVDTSDWDALGEPHHGVFPMRKFDTQERHHGVSQIFVNNRLFQEKVHCYGAQIAMAYYNTEGHITSLRLNDINRNTVFDLKQIQEHDVH